MKFRLVRVQRTITWYGKNSKLVDLLCCLPWPLEHFKCVMDDARSLLFRLSFMHCCTHTHTSLGVDVWFGSTRCLSHTYTLHTGLCRCVVPNVELNIQSALNVHFSFIFRTGNNFDGGHTWNSIDFGSTHSTWKKTGSCVILFWCSPGVDKLIGTVFWYTSLRLSLI